MTIKQRRAPRVIVFPGRFFISFFPFEIGRLTQRDFSMAQRLAAYRRMTTFVFCGGR